MRPLEWRTDLLLAAGVLGFNLLFLGHVGLYDVDEAIFAEATREMVETGDYVTPTYNYEVRWDKPPLIYWLMSVPLRVFGPTSFGARFTSAAAGALLALLLMAFGRWAFDPLAGRVAGVAVATSLHGFFLGHMSLTDMTLALLMAAGWLALFCATELLSWRWFAAAGLALGLATLVKGPVAVVLPGGTWLLYLVLSRQTWRTIKAVRVWLGLALYLAVVLPWCGAIFLAHGTAFFETFLGYHNVSRLTSVQSGHGGPVWFFVAVVAGGFLPWTGWLLSGVAGAARRPEGRAGRALAYTLLWLLCVLGLFSLSRTKLPNYIAPCYPAAALLAGQAASAAWRGERRSGWPVAAGALGLAGLGAVLLSLGAWLPNVAHLRDELGGAVLDPGRGPVIAGAVLLAAAAGLVVVRRPPTAVAAVAVAGAVSWLAVWLAVMPVVYHYQQGTVRLMAAVAADQTAAGGELVSLNYHAPSIAYTMHRRQLRIRGEAGDAGTHQRLVRLLGRPDPVFLITRHKRVRGLLDGVEYHVWADRYGWLLVANRPPPPGFALPPSPWREADLRREGSAP